ncbi:hypothetical protein D4764_13G0011220 [Takifugu flavidus]|uniref:Uncharacterized protein n=1 Tax=Takifugu flavidus TaxID=433684 RepID=A0A5C6PE50_9TELE|nr:hypothetical protein D4764_13G0011220 [Takifugu flavidus]
MQKQFAFFPGKLEVVFRKGPLGFLLQEPSDEAKRVSSTPQDKSAAMREDLVRQNALAVIRQRAGDPSDKMEVLGEYVLQFGKYKGNHSKDSLQSFVSYALSFQEIQALLTYDGGRGDGVTASSEDDQLVGFGKRCVPGTRMFRLQQNLLKRQQPTTSSTPAEHPMKAPAEPQAMEEDVEMEREMLSIHNSDLQVQSYAMPVAAAALPTPLTQDSIEKIVQGILEMQQQQHRPEQKMRQTKTCLACGQPKSRYGTDGSSIHFFCQQGPVRYFYCSRKVHQTYAAEGLSDPRMPFEQFAASEFFQRELEATKKRVEEKARRQRLGSQPPDRLCRFCHLTLKQGPNSPHIQYIQGSLEWQAMKTTGSALTRSQLTLTSVVRSAPLTAHAPML